MGSIGGVGQVVTISWVWLVIACAGIDLVSGCEVLFLFLRVFSLVFTSYFGPFFFR